MVDIWPKHVGVSNFITYCFNVCIIKLSAISWLIGIIKYNRIDHSIAYHIPEDLNPGTFWGYCKNGWGIVSRCVQLVYFNLKPLTWKIWWANNASRWQTGFNSAFKGLKVDGTYMVETRRYKVSLPISETRCWETKRKKNVYCEYFFWRQLIWRKRIW